MLRRILLQASEEEKWTSSLGKHNPTCFPDQLAGPLVWSGQDFERGRELPIIFLSALEVVNVENAREHFKALGIDSSHLARDNFPLDPSLAKRIQGASDLVHGGPGFALIRGLEPKRYTEEDNMLQFAGLLSHIGEERYNMRHITDRSKSRIKTSEKLRPPHLSVAMDFHTDVNSGDILCFYVQNTSMHGGTQRISSFWKVYNDLARDHPEALEFFSQNWRFELPWTDGTTEVIERPLMYYEDEKLMISYASAFVKGSIYDERLPEGPTLPPQRRAALDLFIEKCRDNAFELPTTCGDLVLINNLAILHQRDAFVDDAKQGRVRHLVSAMIRDNDRAWVQPEELSLFADARFATPWAREIVTLPEWHNETSNRVSSSSAQPQQRRTRDPRENELSGTRSVNGQTYKLANRPRVQGGRGSDKQATSTAVPGQLPNAPRVAPVAGGSAYTYGRQISSRPGRETRVNGKDSEDDGEDSSEDEEEDNSSDENNEDRDSGYAASVASAESSGRLARQPGQNKPRTQQVQPDQESNAVPQVRYNRWVRFNRGSWAVASQANPLPDPMVKDKSGSWYKQSLDANQIVFRVEQYSHD